MTTIAIIGSRDTGSYLYEHACEAIDSVLAARNIKPTTIVSGGAKGADKWAERYAEEHGIDMVVVPKSKNMSWTMRDRNIVDQADFVIAFWDYKSGGTGRAIQYTRRVDKPRWVVNINTRAVEL